MSTLTVFSLSDARFALAMERFLQGKSFIYKDVRFELESGGTVLCTVASAWSDRNRVTVASAEADLLVAEELHAELVATSREFQRIVHGRPVRFELIVDTGTSGLSVCTKENGVVVWSRGFPRTAASDRIAGDDNRA
jgi:hypothetical protein